jgi:hypothetical protein
MVVEVERFVIEISEKYIFRHGVVAGLLVTAVWREQQQGRLGWPLQAGRRDGTSVCAALWDWRVLIFSCEM